MVSRDVSRLVDPRSHAVPGIVRHVSVPTPGARLRTTSSGTGPHGAWAGAGRSVPTAVIPRRPCGQRPFGGRTRRCRPFAKPLGGIVSRPIGPPGRVGRAGAPAAPDRVVFREPPADANRTISTAGRPAGGCTRETPRAAPQARTTDRFPIYVGNHFPDRHADRRRRPPERGRTVHAPNEEHRENRRATVRRPFDWPRDSEHRSSRRDDRPASWTTCSVRGELRSPTADVTSARGTAVAPTRSRRGCGGRARRGRRWRSAGRARRPSARAGPCRARAARSTGRG